MICQNLSASLAMIVSLSSSAAAIAQAGEGDPPAIAEQPTEIQSPTAAAGEPAKPAVEQNSGLEDIVVTATRREERLQDIPVSVTAVTAKTLGGSGITHVRELTQVVPGLFGARNASVTQPVIRGVGSTGPGVGDESNVAIYIDGIYQADQFTTSLDLVEVERVEVLRGPQGTVFGRNATGGLINIITPDPSFDSRGRVAAKIGRMGGDANNYDVRGYATGGLSSTLAADVAVLFRQNDGYVKDLVRGGEAAGQRLWLVRSKLLFQPSETARIILSGEYADSNEEQPAFQPYRNNTAGRNFPALLILADDPNEASNDVKPRSTYQRTNIALRTRFELGAVNLETSTGYLTADIQQRADSDASNVPLAFTDVEVHPRTISQEVRLLSATGGRLNWLVGAYAFHLRGRMPFTLGTSAGPPTPAGLPQPFTITNLFPKIRTTSYAGFAEGTYELVDRLFLTLGGRYTNEKREFRQKVNGNPLPFGNAESTFNKFTYRTALRYEFADDANVYVTHGTGFKSGVFNVVGTSPVATDPENITSYEVGLKVDPLDWLRTNLSAYYYDYKDLQASARTESGAFTLQNAANAEVYGGELEITASPITDLDIRASAAYTHGEYTEFEKAQVFIPRPTGGNIVDQRDVSGNYMVRAPRYTFSIGGNYRWDLGGGRAELNGNLFRSSKLYYDFLNVAKQPAYTLLNGELAWITPDEGWRFSLWGSNLTDAKVYQMLQAGGAATTSFYQKPRMIGFGAERRF